METLSGISWNSFGVMVAMGSSGLHSRRPEKWNDRVSMIFIERHLRTDKLQERLLTRHDDVRNVNVMILTEDQSERKRRDSPTDENH